MKKVLHKITTWSRPVKKSIMMLFDSISLVVIILASFPIRLGYWSFPENTLLLLTAIAPVIALPIFNGFGLYKSVVRYIGFKALWAVAQSVSIYSLVWGLAAFMLAIDGFPRSIVLINWSLAILVIGSSRMLARWLLTVASYSENKKNIIIYGAGSAGRELSRALESSEEYSNVAFVDDYYVNQVSYIHGVPVENPKKLSQLIFEHDINEVFLAIPSLSRNRRREIVNYLEQFSVVIRFLPSLSDIAKGSVKIQDLLEIDLTDLLGRDSVQPNKEFLNTNILNKVVLVTGAGGSIGSELCRQILSLRPKKLILFELSESALYQIEQELLTIKMPNVDIYPIIGSVADKERLEMIFNFYKVQTIYHAAAYKHVPLVECNQSQGVLNNTIGTLKAAEAAISSNVETFVLISTDKAVRPTNIMGASKRAAELILQAFSKLSHKTCFTMVRFGNVIDSSGSVIPLFKKQIKAGGPLTVTHKDIVRYFMTIPEAVELVIQAGVMADGGEVFVLDMGDPIRIYDLAVKMIKLSGLEVLDNNNPKGDIEIIYSGLRPGEKLFEELLVSGKFSQTENELIMRTEEEMLSWDLLEPLINEIQEASIKTETNKIYDLLKQLIPEFSSSYQTYNKKN